ncbi:Unknown protein, partial [Striga hermonthica]
RPSDSSRPPVLEVKRLSPEEIKRRREKGLCFKCDEKFMPGHQCNQAFVIHFIDNEEPEIEEDWDQEVEIGVPEEEAEILMHAMAGTRGPTTMLLPALVKDRRVVVLVDNGSSHNFINTDLSQKLKFPTMKVEPFEVRVANGEQLKCSEAYRAIPIKFQGVTIKADLYALPLVGPDVVLGVQWLEGLGKMTTDYRMGVMEFDSGEHRVTLKASKDSRAKEFGLKSIERVWHDGGQIFTVEEVGAYASMVEHVSTEYDGPPIFDVYLEDELMDDEVFEEAEIMETEVEGEVPEDWTIELQQSEIRELVRASNHILGESDKEEGRVDG